MKTLTITISDKAEKEMQELLDNKTLKSAKDEAGVLDIAFGLLKAVVDELRQGKQVLIADNNHTIVKEIVV